MNLFSRPKVWNRFLQNTQNTQNIQNDVFSEADLELRDSCDKFPLFFLIIFIPNDFYWQAICL